MSTTKLLPPSPTRVSPKESYVPPIPSPLNPTSPPSEPCRHDHDCAQRGRNQPTEGERGRAKACRKPHLRIATGPPRPPRFNGRKDPVSPPQRVLRQRAAAALQFEAWRRAMTDKQMRSLVDDYSASIAQAVAAAAAAATTTTSRLEGVPPSPSSSSSLSAYEVYSPVVASLHDSPTGRDGCRGHGGCHHGLGGVDAAKTRREADAAAGDLSVCDSDDDDYFPCTPRTASAVQGPASPASDVAGARWQHADDTDEKAALLRWAHYRRRQQLGPHGGGGAGAADLESGVPVGCVSRGTGPRSVRSIADAFGRRFLVWALAAVCLLVTLALVRIAFLVRGPMLRM